MRWEYALAHTPCTPPFRSNTLVAYVDLSWVLRSMVLVSLAMLFRDSCHDPVLPSACPLICCSSTALCTVCSSSTILRSIACCSSTSFDPSHLGPRSTGSFVISALRFKKAFVCLSVQMLSSLKLDMIC